MSSPKGIGGSVREGTRVVLKEITASLHNSPPIQPPRRKNGNTDSAAPRTAEHEIKVRFAREFADVGSAITENHGCSTPESLSSASSFRSLSSTVSSVKSSSGICVDSTPNTPDDVADTSYVNSNIPGVEDLILACADINLGSDSQDLSQDQTFASAIDETSFHASDSSVDESLSDNNTGDETRVIVNTNSQLQETAVCTSLNETRVLESLDNALYVERARSVSPVSTAEQLHAPRVEESFEKPVPLQEDDSVTSEPETCAVQSNVAEGSPSDRANNNRLNVTIDVSSHNSIPDVSEVLGLEEQTVDSYHSAETRSPEKFLSPTEISVPSASPLVQRVKDPSSLDVSNVSSPSLEDTNSESPKNLVHDLPESVRSTSPTSLSTFDNTDKESEFALPRIRANSPVIDAEKNEIVKHSDLPRLDNCAAVADNEAAGSTPQLLLNRTNIVEPKASEVSLDTSIEKRDTEIRNIAALIAKTSLFEDVAVCNDETRGLEERRKNSPETTVVESAAAATCAVKKKETSFEEFDRTLTLQEIESINLTPDDEQYDEFKPQRQSTTLSCLIKEQPDFEDLISTAEQVTNELLDPSSEFTEETEQFVSATSEIFQDPSTFDFLLARSNSMHTNIDRLRTESLYVKFDPLVSSTSMLPQGNAQPINEEQNGKNESSLSNIETPKRNPAIAAIDRLLFYSPLSSGTVQKFEETNEKIEEPKEESKSDTLLIPDIDMSKELELVRTSVLQLEEELQKEREAHTTELERQKTTFQEKINKLQAQMSQEAKTKTQMSVVVEEYEKSISRLLAERERDRTNFEQEKAKLQEELQAANHHLTNTEAAFNDVHQKYERLKGVVSVYKNNEAVLKESIQENVDTIKTLETRYEQLKEHAMAQLEKANLELDGIRKQNDAETVKLHAMIRKAELKSNSLAELVEQKTKENKELAKILDEVIARVGHGNTE